MKNPASAGLFFILFLLFKFANDMSTLTLVIQCPDQKGIIAEVTQFIYSHKGNILYIDQYVDRENKAFYASGK